jgi:anti-sigma B factor antagonist
MDVRFHHIMSCKAAVHHAGNVAVVDLSGRITLGEGCALVRSTVQDLVKAGDIRLLLNLADVSYMDSAGLGELVGSYASVTNKGGKIKLLNAQGKVAEVLNVTKLYTVFETFTDEAAAVRSFA